MTLEGVETAVLAVLDGLVSIRILIEGLSLAVLGTLRTLLSELNVNLNVSSSVMVDHSIFVVYYGLVGLFREHHERFPGVHVLPSKHISC